jgi:hypothetical protein
VGNIKDPMFPHPHRNEQGEFPNTQDRKAKKHGYSVPTELKGEHVTRKTERDNT